MSRKKIGIVLEFGFHDLKKYIYSDFGKELAKHFDIVWLAIQKNSEEFHKLFSETGFPIIYFEQNEFPSPSITENRNLSVRRYWMKKNKLGQFHNYQIVAKSKIKTLILGNDFLKGFYESKTLRLVENKYYNFRIAKSIENHCIDFLFSTGYSSSFTKSVFVTGHKLGKPCFLLINNWKDLYINNFVPFKFLSYLFVWDETMKADFLKHMPYLNPSRIVVSGNPVFDSLRNSKPRFDRLFYAKKYNISPDARWLYYTMMSPFAGIDEIEIVKLIGREILKVFSRNEVIILLRKNPQHKREDYLHEELPENIILTEHFSYFDKEKDMHIQTPEGEQEWIDLLHYCSMNLSVPSTVTLEFLTLNKPVINIGFGPDGNPDPRLNQHLEAGFYKPIFKNNLVDKVLYIKELNYKIKLVLSQASSSGGMDRNNLASDLAGDLILKRILEN